jgi:hypothetical protein
MSGQLQLQLLLKPHEQPIKELIDSHMHESHGYMAMGGVPATSGPPEHCTAKQTTTRTLALKDLRLWPYAIAFRDPDTPCHDTMLIITAWDQGKQAHVEPTHAVLADIQL